MTWNVRCLPERRTKVSVASSVLLREALDDVLKKYNDRFGAPPRG